MSGTAASAILMTTLASTADAAEFLASFTTFSYVPVNFFQISVIAITGIRTGCENSCGYHIAIGLYK
ncbi:hypothetical protein DPMN_015097 [Dreissena polymorpha]|uniref:Uncharacterized protein n=1 Tax=Dreissena polymorpha TaxID=45954 RepID=A0A9D4NAG8_DREPO|nr:hypothetical protein DPMN_015097 [Dreissena polymorpha]